MTDKLKNICAWCEEDSRIKTLILVGSYARGEESENSDIDLMVVTDDKESLLSDCTWIDIYGKSREYRFEYYGPCTSVRVFYEDGTEIEYGIVGTSWLNVPLDEGTKRVLQDGYKVLVTIL